MKNIITSIVANINTMFTSNQDRLLEMEADAFATDMNKQKRQEWKEASRTFRKQFDMNNVKSAPIINQALNNPFDDIAA